MSLRLQTRGPREINQFNYTRKFEGGQIVMANGIVEKLIISGESLFQ